MFFNQDTYEVSHEDGLLAEVYFRIQVDEIDHTRKVYDAFAWLEAMGGVPEILKSIATLFVGTYLSFHAAMVNISYLYLFRSER